MTIRSCDWEYTMPKETFFNLPEEKRALICQVAMDEFADYSFEQASINRIVTKSGIAKGSFYQYFADKKDLYLYLLSLAAQEKIKYLTPVMNSLEQADFFQLLHGIYLAAIKFAIENPKYSQISKKVLQNRNSPIYQEIIHDNTPTANEFFKNLLRNAITKGEVRADINLEMVAYLITSLHTIIAEYYMERVSVDFDASMLQTYETFIDFLRNGLRATQPAAIMEQNSTSGSTIE